jgi:hypothetical protein
MTGMATLATPFFMEHAASECGRSNQLETAYDTDVSADRTGFVNMLQLLSVGARHEPVKPKNEAKMDKGRQA